MATDIAMDLPAAAQPETRSWTRRLPMIIGIILVIALAGWGVRRWLYGRNHVSSDNAQVDGHITSIAPRIAGFIDRVAVEENQHVKLGDTLVVLDRRDLIARLEQAEADLRNAEALVSGRHGAGQAVAQLQATRAGRPRPTRTSRRPRPPPARPKPTTSATGRSPPPRSSPRSSSTRPNRRAMRPRRTSRPPAVAAPPPAARSPPRAPRFAARTPAWALRRRRSRPRGSS